MDSENRMDGCVCANGAKVAEIVHPYCPAHVPPEMEAELASLRAEVERLKAELKQARKDRDREALDRQTAGDAWNDMRRQRDTALADLARVTPSAEVRAAWSRVSRYVGHSGAHEDACDAADIVNDWLASLPGSDKEPGGFCACGRRTSECDRSRKACTSSVAP